MGTNETKSTSAPVSANDRLNAYNAFMSPQYYNAGSVSSDYGMNMGANLGPDYSSPGFKSMSGGDYDRLEQNIVASRTAPLESAWKVREGDINQQMADRGIWASGAPIKVQNETFARDFLPAYQQAGAEAAVQRYGAQAAETAAQNAFNQKEAEQQWNAGWRRPDFAAGIYNGTGGVISSSSGGGWSI